MILFKNILLSIFDSLVVLDYFELLMSTEMFQ